MKISHAYYSATISSFLADDPDRIAGVLSTAHDFALEHEQKAAWQHQVITLQKLLRSSPAGHIFFEFSIPRMGKRADVVVLIGSTVFVIEYKVGSSEASKQDLRQTHDYALDLKNFHEASHDLPIIPVLIPTGLSGAELPTLDWATDDVAAPIAIAEEAIPELLTRECRTKLAGSIDAIEWADSRYKPTPTIVEAAQSLYSSHTVTDITRSDAGAKNLNQTSEFIERVIDNAKANSEKAICFITGVPGAGKTLVGLNISVQRGEKSKEEHAVFLSGNGPLVNVLREALARDKSSRENITKTDAKREVNSFIQNIHHFRDDALRTPNAPVEHVVIFDEAQRAWDKAQTSRFMTQKRGQAGFDKSEPEFLIGVMDRHEEWCVIVCLVGGGQEINTGEAGIGEWLSALQSRYTDWKVYASQNLDTTNYVRTSGAQKFLRSPSVKPSGRLHLGVSMRSFRAESLSSAVGALLENDLQAAQYEFARIRANYPIFLTRDLEELRDWLKSKRRGSERCGLLASSGAYRLRAEGLNVKAKVDPPVWFLNDPQDVRSSDFLEEVATEFDVQGLELDWAGVCWDADLRYVDGKWQHWNFKGTKWQAIKKADRKLYLENAYRVLLTRARQGLGIFVPHGSSLDPTRPEKFFDASFDALSRSLDPIQRFKPSS